MNQPALAVFRNRSFTLMWTAQLVSTFGDALTQLAAGILVFRLTGSVLSVGLMFTATTLPTLLVGLVAGVYVDRWDRKKILVASCFVQALFVALIPVMLPFGVVWLYVLVALSSTVRQFFDPANSSVVPDVTDDAALEAANSMMSISATASSILGFAAGGTLSFGFEGFGTGRVTVKTVRLLGTTTTGGTVRVYGGATLLKTVAVPRLGSSGSRTLTLSATNANKVVVTLTGAGKMDDLVVSQ